MARIIALFDSYETAHRAAQHLIREGLPARVTYLLEEMGQGADSVVGVSPRLEREDRVPSGLDVAAGPRTITAPTFALSGADSLVASPTLEERLRELGLEDGQIHRLLEQVADGGVAAVFRFDGPAEEAMALLSERGARAVEQVFSRIPRV